MPSAIIGYMRNVLGVRPLTATALKRYDRSGSKPRHQKLLREYVDIRCPMLQPTTGWNPLRRAPHGVPFKKRIFSPD